MTSSFQDTTDDDASTWRSLRDEGLWQRINGRDEAVPAAQPLMLTKSVCCCWSDQARGLGRRSQMPLTVCAASRPMRTKGSGALAYGRGRVVEAQSAGARHQGRCIARHHRPPLACYLPSDSLRYVTKYDPVL